MTKINTAKQEDTLTATAGKLYAGIVTVFLLVTLMIFPLFYDNFYFNIMRAKYVFYYMSVLAMLLAFLMTTLIFAFIDQKEYGGSNRKRLLQKLSPVPFWKNCTAVDKALLIFLLLAVISTLQSDYLYEAFWGNEGRYSGLFLILLYASTVFLIGKFGRIRQWHLEAFLLAGGVVCLLGALDYFMLDPLGFKELVEAESKTIFTSTLGNINTYTAFVALEVGVAVGLFMVERNGFRALLHYAFILLGFFAIITGQSDNAYLALGALFGLLPLVMFASRTGIRRYALTVAGFISVVKIIADINDKIPDKVIGLSGIFRILTEYNKLSYIVFALWSVAIILYIGEYTVWKGKADQLGQRLRLLWTALLAVAVAVIVYILFDANFGGNAEKYKAISQYVVFDDNWGTNRGYCWRIGWESYMAQPLMHKLFGFGPDTFGILTWPFREESIQNYGVFFESAHNEYFQYLVTMGPFAMLSYVAFLGLSCREMLKSLKANPWVLAPLAAVVCYGAQALVNINLPIATPVMWTLLAVGLAVCRSGREVMQKETKKGQHRTGA